MIEENLHAELVKIVNDSMDAYRRDISNMRETLHHRSLAQKAALMGDLFHELSAIHEAAVGPVEGVNRDMLHFSQTVITSCLNEIEEELRTFGWYAKKGLKNR